MRQDHEEPRFDIAPEIAAEAASEYSRTPSYDELWRIPQRAAQRRDDRPRGGGFPVIAAMIAIIVGCMGLIGLREKIVRAAPPTAAAYAAFGLPVNLAGLELRGVHSQIVMEGPRKVLTIEGEIVNTRREANRVPSVALTVRSETGQEKYSWTTQAPKSKLEAGEKIAFRARLASPPEGGSDVLVRFASLDEAKPPLKLPPMARK
jgi:hypothetical protein